MDLYDFWNIFLSFFLIQRSRMKKYYRIKKDENVDSPYVRK